MKRIVLLFTAFLLLFQYSIVNAQPNNEFNVDVLSAWGLKGPVKSLKEMTYKVADTSGEIQKGELEKTEQFQYDKKGNRIEVILYSQNGKLIQKINYKFDSREKKIEENIFSSGNNVVNENIFKYDSFGNKIEWVSKQNDKPIVKYIYVYDNKGNVIESYLISSGMYESFGKSTYKYNRKGNKIEDNHYTPDGVIIHKSKYKYAKNGKIVVKSRSGSFGKYYNKSTWKYDNHGNIIEFKRNHTLVSKSKFVYDNFGKIITESRYGSHGKLISVSNFTYDSIGNIIKVNNTTIQYNYDANGNWIYCIKFLNKTPFSLIEREIEYYE